VDTQVQRPVKRRSWDSAHRSGVRITGVCLGVWLLTVGLGATGCQTLFVDPLKAETTARYPKYRVYSGTRYYFAMIGEERAVQRIVLTVDLPFSFALDTVLLPITIPLNLARSIEKD
jgi:uncharacterized protein YceK